VSVGGSRMSTNNNSTEIIAKGSTFQGREMEQGDYPDPATLPLPSQEPRIADVTLSELIPRRYISITARVVYLRVIEKQDALGSKMIFLSIGRKKMETANLLKQTIGIICKACGKNKVALACTADSNLASKGLIPKPAGGLYLKHAANVIVHIKEQSGTSTIPSFKATLLKHQYIKTPKSAILYTKKTGGITLLD
jgi:hypothetical protein